MKIAIVEDDKDYSSTLNKYIDRYGKENGILFSVTSFADGERFVTEYQSGYDIVFMDIEMPVMNGIEASTKIRQIDTQCVIIFVSNYMKYAIQGYSVNATDFLTKPLEYDIFKNSISKAILSIRKRANNSISITSASEIHKIDANDIIYIEVCKHRVIFHTTNGTFDTRGTLQDAEKQLPSTQFIKCNSGYLVNLRYVTGMTKDTLITLDGELAISRSRKKDVLDALTRYIGA